EAAQRERERAELTRERERLGLAWRQFERRGLADHDLLAVLLAERLVDRQDADVRQDRFADLGLSGAGLFGFAVAARENHVDAVVRQDEAAGAGLRGDFGRDRAHALVEHGGHVARAVRLDQLGLADRFARDERRARDGAGKLLDRVGLVAAAHEGGTGGRHRPDLPLHVLLRHRRAELDVVLRDQDVDGIDLGARLRRLGGRSLLAATAREQRGKTTGGNGYDENDYTRGFHTLYFPRSRCGRTGPTRWISPAKRQSMVNGAYPI